MGKQMGMVYETSKICHLCGWFPTKLLYLSSIYLKISSRSLNMKKCVSEFFIFEL